MIREILPNLYQVKIPLPNNPLKNVNSYIIKTQRRNLIIDTGMNQPESKGVMAAALKKLDINLETTDFFITHLHMDHIGLVKDFATNTSTIYFNQPDATDLSCDTIWDDYFSFARMNGFPEKELKEVFKKHPGYRFCQEKGDFDFCILKENDNLLIGDYLFKCVETPGHTQGSMCLYDANKKIFISGDHLLSDVTPNISLWSKKGNPLNQYLLSLDKVYELDINLVLPGHRGIFVNYKRRIKELKHHHLLRKKEVISILKKGSKDAFQVASQMDWDIFPKKWDLFPVMQKWFATGEAIAHLKDLEEKKLICHEIINEKIIFFSLI
jgi:glyoxylase-like metal-dependent hydrolase (beta-lactamase superfamily II)